VADATVPGQFDVIGTHTYTQPVANTLSVNIRDAGGSSITANSRANAYSLVVAGDTGVAGNVITLDNLPDQPNSYEVVVNGQRRASGPWSSVAGGIDLLPGNGVNVVNIENVAAGVPATVSLGSGTDTVAVSPLAHALDNILGTVAVNGGTGIATLNVDDQSATAVQAGTLTPTTFQREGSGQISFNRLAALNLNAGTNQRITVQGTASGNTAINAAGGHDTIIVQATAPGTNTTITTGYLDTIVVGTDASLPPALRSSLDAIRGSVTVDGQGRWVGALDVADQAATQGRNYILTSNSLSWGNPAVRIFFSTVATVVLDGANGGDTVGVQSLFPGLPITLHGGAGFNTIVAPDTPNTWYFDGVTDAVGRLDGYLVFEVFGHLVGGAGEDVFAFADGQRTFATLDGGGGMNWLDYSAYTTPVTVNLASGTATGVGRDAIASLTRIENVVGGAGNDRLTGDRFGNVLLGGAGDDTLTAGSGNSILIGGGGADNLIANAGTPGFDVLIGGATDFDSPSATNRAVLDAFFRIWRTTNATNYASQVLSLQFGGVGVNGATYRLDSSVVHLRGGDHATLLGASPNQAALDWFFSGAADPLNLKLGEFVTRIS
jgi:hypothetical protein